jgi:hypothetical protein
VLGFIVVQTGDGRCFKAQLVEELPPEPCQQCAGKMN